MNLKSSDLVTMRYILLDSALKAFRSPVGDEPRVDVSVLALVFLLSDCHLSNGSPQPRQEEAGDQQVGHHRSRALTAGMTLHAVTARHAIHLFQMCSENEFNPT